MPLIDFFLVWLKSYSASIKLDLLSNAIRTNLKGMDPKQGNISMLSFRLKLTLTIVLIVLFQSASAVRLSPTNGEIAFAVIGHPVRSSGETVIVPSTATAVALNVTAVNPSAPGFITVYPCGVPRPNASNLNFKAGDVVPNGVIASVGSNGGVCFYSSQETDLIVDFSGWFEGGGYVGATPTRLNDTRDGTGGLLGPIGGARQMTIPIANLTVVNAAGDSTTIPSDVTAVALNVTVVNPAQSGFVTVWPCDVDKPFTSSLNYTQGAVIPNGVIAPVAADGTVCVFSQVDTNLIVDLAGWFPGEAFVGATPLRSVDTRTGLGGRGTPLSPPENVNVQVGGVELVVKGSATQVPLSARAAALNVTVVNPSSAGFATVWPCSDTRPDASNLNFVAGQVVANNVIAPLGSNGDICIYTNVAADIVVDNSGWFNANASDSFVGTTPNRIVDTRTNVGPLPGEQLTTTNSGGSVVDAAIANNLYTDNIHNQIIQTKCIICHIVGGVAGSTPLIYSTSESSNLQVIRDYVTTDSEGANRILDKSRGVGHGGGAQLSAQSTDYTNLVAFLEAISGESITQQSIVSFFEGATLSNPPETIRRASIILQGHVPTRVEMPPVNASKAALKATLKELMQGEIFHDFLIRGANDRLHTDAFLEGLFLEIGDLNTYRFPIGANEYSKFDNNDMAQQRIKDDFANRFRYGLARSPLELIAWVVENNRPYTEILTADFMMMTPQVNEFLRGTAEFVTASETEFQPGQHRGQIYGDSLLEQTFIPEFGSRVTSHSGFLEYPHAGLLNSLAFLNRYPSTETNRNRARARWALFHFLGVDIERSASRTTDPEALADTNNPTMNNPNCTVCHSQLDPVAGLFQNHGDLGFYREAFGGMDSLPDSYKFPERFPDAQPTEYVAGDTWYRDMRRPGFNGAFAPDAANSLQWLAQQMIKDPRFAIAAIRFWWPAVMGTAPLIAPEVSTDLNFNAQLAAFDVQNTFINDLGAQFTAGIDGGPPFDFKDLLVELILSPWFRVKDLDPTNAGAALKQLGANRLLTPIELDNKVSDLLGWRWGEHPQGQGRTHLKDNYRIYYGGIDSVGIQQRSRELTPLMYNVAERMAIHMACGATVYDFFIPNDERRLFFDITPGDTPISQLSSVFEVAGGSHEEVQPYTTVGELSGENQISIYFLNDYFEEDTQADRNLIVDKVTVTTPGGTIIFTQEMENIQSTPNAVVECGSPHFSPNAQNSADGFNIFGSCNVTFPLGVNLTAGEYSVNVHAYGQQAGPDFIQMSVTTSTNDTNASAGAAKIKQKLVDLHSILLGEEHALNSVEVEQSYELLVLTWEARVMQDNRHHSWTHPEENCNYPPFVGNPFRDGGVGSLDRDPTGMKNAWTSLLIYFMTDYKFLHE